MSLDQSECDAAIENLECVRDAALADYASALSEAGSIATGHDSLLIKFNDKLTEILAMTDGPAKTARLAAFETLKDSYDSAHLAWNSQLTALGTEQVLANAEYNATIAAAAEGDCTETKVAMINATAARYSAFASAIAAFMTNTVMHSSAMAGYSSDIDNL